MFAPLFTPALVCALVHTCSKEAHALVSALVHTCHCICDVLLLCLRSELFPLFVHDQPFLILTTLLLSIDAQSNSSKFLRLGGFI